MTEYRLYLVDTQPLTETTSCDYYEARTPNEEPIAQFTITPSYWTAEWFVDTSLAEFTTLVEDEITPETRTSIVTATETPDGTVIEEPFETATAYSWYPDFCTYFKLDVSKTTAVAWDHSPPSNSIIITEHSESTNLFESLFHETGTDLEVVQSIAAELMDLTEEDGTANTSHR